jgi:hypothetical protein
LNYVISNENTYYIMKALFGMNLEISNFHC